jgi:hypothetical protein
MPYPVEVPRAGIINNKYAYPNPNSYYSFGREGSPNLWHGFLASMTNTQDGTHTSSTTLLKKFQFNPSTSEIVLQMVDVDPAATQNAGGNDTAGGVGAATTGVKLAFNREIEVYRAANGLADTPSYFKDLGVQKDVLDIYRVMLGADTPSALGTRDGGGMNDMLGEIFDSGSASKLVNMRPIIVSFNETLTYFGQVRGFSYEFQKFNSKLVPTIVAMTINVDILNISTKKAIQNQQSAALTPQPGPGPGMGGGLGGSSSTTVPNSGPSTPQGPGTQLPPPYISSGGIHWGS